MKRVCASALGANAATVHAMLMSQGASFIADIAAAAGLGSQATREGLRELVAAGLVTNDTVDALHDALRWKSVPSVRGVEEADFTRWLPADFKPSEHRPVVQRRASVRRLAKWRRPDRDDGSLGSWAGRWALVHLPGTLGPAIDDHASAEQVARKWLDRYGIVSRDWWKREHPAARWRDIYHELKRLEFRGEVQRGYFVTGLAGAQFALPEAVELLRLQGAADEDSPVVLLPSDPANVYNLPLAAGTEVDSLARPRGAGALLVTVRGVIIIAAERRGGRLRVRESATSDEVRDAARALGERLVGRAGSARRRDVVVETIDGVRSAGSRWAEAFVEGGYRSLGTLLRYFAAV